MTEEIKNSFFSLKGHILIAMPTMEDSRFDKSIIFMCEHTREGAMGIVLNKPMTGISFIDILKQLNLVNEDSEEEERDDKAVEIYRGGPVETGRGFVLHSPDYYIDQSTHIINSNISLTETLDILKAIHSGERPKDFLLALGYAGWSAGQLESEIQKNGWLHAEASHELVFNTDKNSKYTKALSSLGIDPVLLSMQAGHA